MRPALKKAFLLGFFALFQLSAFAKDIVFTKTNHWFNAGECYVHIVETLRGQPFDDRDITVDKKGVWHDARTHADIECDSPSAGGFNFTVRRNGSVIATARLVGANYNKLVISSQVFLPLQ